MPAKILVVDDEPDLEVLIRQKFRRQIRQQELHFEFARNGVTALEMLRTQEFDLVLTDIHMPEMDGLTLLGKLPDVNPALKAVVVTAYGDMGNIRTAMQRGAYDFLTKPIDFQDLEVTITHSLLPHVQQYMRCVARLTEAAEAVERGSFEPASLDDVTTYDNELGRLARVFQEMACEVQAREQRLQQQVQELRIEIDQVRKAHQVAAVTESEYFRRLQHEAKTLRARAAAQRGTGV